MKGYVMYRNETAVILEVIRNTWANRTEYLIAIGNRTEWISEYEIGEVVWKVG